MKMSQQYKNSDSMRTRGVSVDFECLSRYGVDSNRKIITNKGIRPSKNRVKCLENAFEKESIGFWEDADGKNFLSNFSESDVDKMAETDGESEPQINSKGDEDLQEGNQGEKGAEGDSQKSAGTENEDKVSLNAPNSDNDQLDSPVKTKQQVGKKKLGKHAKLSSEVKAKMEEERLLKRECDALEAELIQTQKIQDNIDKYREKIRDLKRRKEGEKLKNVRTKSKVESIKLDKGVHKACKVIMDLLEVNDIDEQHKFLAVMAEKAADRKRARRDSRASFKKKHAIDISSSSSSGSESSSSSSDEGSPVRRRRKSRSRSRSNSRNKGKLCSGINEKPKESDLVMKVKWATAMLGTRKEINFDEMTFDQYILGESQILNRAKISSNERKTRVHLMKRISKLNEKLGFVKSKELYRETLNAIEKGEFGWCNFYEIERLENEIRFENMKVEDTVSEEDQKRKKQLQSEPRWCKEFNAGKCTFTGHHQGKFAGVSTKMWHMCRVCWGKLKEKKFHKANTEECQFNSNKE